MERTIISFDYAIKNILRDKANFTVLNGFLSELLNKQVAVEEIIESESNIRVLLKLQFQKNSIKGAYSLLYSFNVRF